MAEIAVPLLVAFAMGLGAERTGLPPLVGYLLAGFLMASLGFEAGEGIDTVADIGVLLLLFGIGLKLRPRALARPVVWLGATAHMAIWVLVATPLLLAIGALGLPVLRDLDLGQAALVGFALSFSSTVFAAKALQATNETKSLAGRIAIGTLVVQDLAAVIFLVLVADTPSPWAVPVVAGVVLARPIWRWLLERVGYDELLPLLGLALALGAGAAAFEAVGVKADLGALVIGMLLAGHPRTIDLARSILSLKDVLLVGFFLSIGLNSPPSTEAVVVGLVLLALGPLKSLGHLALLSRFRIRGRTTWHATVSLATFSEFGLIVVAVAVTDELLPPVWATTIALVVAASFVVASPPNRLRYELYVRWHRLFERLERTPVHEDDALIDPGRAAVLVFGMGRIGEGAYDELVAIQDAPVVGVDRSEERARRQVEAGRRVIRGDALDADFWERITLHPETVLVLLAMMDHQANAEAARRIRATNPNIVIGAIASHAAEVAELRSLGVGVSRDLFEEAGRGLADDARAVVPSLHRATDTT